MHELINGIKGHVDAMLQQLPQPVWGIVTDVDPNRYMIRCLVQPSNVTTGWLSVGSVMVGNGWGLVAPPMTGMQAQLMPSDGAGDNYTVTGLCYSTQAIPPKPGGNVVVPGEIAIQSKAGS
jgi:phage baseplate assembly protein gpV